MMSLTRTRGFALYFFRNRLPYVATVVILLAVYVFFPKDVGEVTNRWKDIDPLLSAMTFFTALAVFAWEAYQDWKSDLPKKLTVIYKYEGKEVMRCNRADLLSKADIRALSQQLGSQMANYNQLKFRAASVKPSGGGVAHESDGLPFIDYAVTFQLTEIPPGLSQDECVTWDPPFEKRQRIANSAP